MPTALELTRDRWQGYITGARRRTAVPERTPLEQRRRELLLDRVRQAASVLKSRLGARRVVLFGSLAHEAWFAADSDVDLAVEGLVGDDYWRAWRLAEEIIGDRPVDLIDLETASESLQQAIERHGVEL